MPRQILEACTRHLQLLWYCYLAIFYDNTLVHGLFETGLQEVGWHFVAHDAFRLSGF